MLQRKGDMEAYEGNKELQYKRVNLSVDLERKN